MFRGGGIPLPFRVCVADLVSFPFLGVFVAVVGLFSSRRRAGWFVTGACSFLGGGGVSVVVFFEVHKAPQCSPYWGAGGLLVEGEGAAVPPLLYVFCLWVVGWCYHVSWVFLDFCGGTRAAEFCSKAYVVELRLCAEGQCMRWS